MSLPNHAITPTDTRQPVPQRLHPANVASRERSMQALNLALQIADLEAQGLVEMYAHEVEREGQHWFDLQAPPSDMALHQADMDFAREQRERAVRYIELRDPSAFRMRLVRHPDMPHLVRFERAP